MANNIPNLQFSQGATPMPTMQAMPQNFGSPLSTPMGAYQPNSIFMQPIGNIYGLSNASEVGNIPMGAGISVGLCLSEGTMYLKSMQNNGPVLLGYKLSPLENTQSASGGPPPDLSLKIEQMLKGYNDRLSKIEQLLTQSENPKGGKTEWQL